MLKVRLAHIIYIYCETIEKPQRPMLYAYKLCALYYYLLRDMYIINIYIYILVCIMYIRASICFNCCQVSGDMFVCGYTRRPGARCAAHV